MDKYSDTTNFHSNVAYSYAHSSAIFPVLNLHLTGSLKLYMKDEGRTIALVASFWAGSPVSCDFLEAGLLTSDGSFIWS